MIILQIVLWVGGLIVAAVVAYVIVRLIVGWTYRHVDQGKALVRNGLFGTKVSVNGIVVLPIVQRLEYMDISVKKIEIDRHGPTGLICQDNLRADIKVTFYVRVDSSNLENVKHVAITLGCARASDEAALVQLFEPKFSDALKTAGREFNFEDLLNKRAEFREAIKRHVGTDLNGYVLDDAAIDLLEQTKVEMLDPENILDSEGIKLITQRTATQAIFTNELNRNRERDINKKDVETRELILEQNRQLAEAEEKQKREVAAIKAREESTTLTIQQQEKLKSEKARIATEEEVQVSEEKKNREIIVARKNKERTDAVETVRVEKDRQIEDTEREKVVTLAGIAKTKAIETEQKNIQDVIRERVIVQKAVVIEEQRIKDTEAFATVEREKKVKVTQAEAEADQLATKTVKAAEADKRTYELAAERDFIVSVKAAEAKKRAAELGAEEEIIEAEGIKSADGKRAEGKKLMADGVTAEQAAAGLAEARVTIAKADAIQKQGTAEANVMEQKFTAEAEGITKKAEAMKLFHNAGREHEEFKLQLALEKDLGLAELGVRRDIASSQAHVVGEALKTAKVEIVGGETEFFNRIVGAVTGGKAVDHLVDSSSTLSGVRDTFFGGDSDYFRNQLQKWTSQFGLTTEDLKNLTISAALAQMIPLAPDGGARSVLQRLLKMAEKAGLDTRLLGDVLTPEEKPKEKVHGKKG